MLEILVSDKCECPEGKAPTSRFCTEKNRFCFETPSVEHLPNGTTQVFACLFETENDILGAIGSRLRPEERTEFARIWTDDAYPRKFTLDGSCLRIKGNYQKASIPRLTEKSSSRESVHKQRDLFSLLF